MITDDTYAQEGVPTNLLGLHWKYWTKNGLLTILGHYGINRDRGVRKLNLMCRLNQLVRTHGLNRTDRLRIESACRRRIPLPPRKPRILRSLPSSGLDNGSQRTRTGSHVRRAVGNIDYSRPKYNISAPTATLSANETSFPAVYAVASINCVVCLEELEATAFPNHEITGACNHEPNVCLECLSISIATQFTNKVWDHIDCPSCGERLDFMDIKDFADPAVFERQESAGGKLKNSG